MSQNPETDAQGFSQQRAYGEEVPGGVLPAELLATVGHEFRGPLTTIQGYATTLLRHDQRLTPEERQDFLQAISEASTQLSKLVDRFLELAQLETQAYTFLPVLVNLSVLAREEIAVLPKSGYHALRLTPSLASGEILLEGEQTEGDAWTLAGDRRLLRTMLRVLLENALAYSAPGSLIEVSIEPGDVALARAALQAPLRPGGHRALILPEHFQEQEPLLILRVQDHGIGISSEHLPLIFRRFYRVDSSLTRQVNGLGLGLTMCKAIVALHRGMFWVESVVGEGSVFVIVLPCKGLS